VQINEFLDYLRKSQAMCQVYNDISNGMRERDRVTAESRLKIEQTMQYLINNLS